MRLTIPLCKQRILWEFEKKWKVVSKRKIRSLYVPPIFEELGIEIVDAKDLVRSETDLKWENTPKVELPEPYATDLFQEEGPRHPYWKEKEVYLFARNCRLIEGNPQICVLTKTIQYEGLPATLKNLEGNIYLPNQDELVQDRIMGACVWDGIQRRLPKKLDITRPGWIFPREYGIPVHRKVWNLQQSLINLSNVATGKYGSWKRTHLAEACNQVFCEKEESQILFQIQSDTTVLAQKPLPPVGNKEQTLDEKLPDIFPLKYTIDIPKTNIYDEGEVYPITTNFHNVHVHTVHISHNKFYYWHQHQKLARAIAAVFSFAVAQAHQLYGVKVKHLPVPITVQGVYMDLNTVGFLVYQLNTLNLDLEDGIKNQVWVDGPHQLFKECSEDRGVVDYEPSVIRKLFAIHANGLTL